MNKRDHPTVSRLPSPLELSRDHELARADRYTHVSPYPRRR